MARYRGLWVGCWAAGADAGATSAQVASSPCRQRVKALRVRQGSGPISARRSGRREVPQSDERRYDSVKRAMDLVAAGLGLFVLAPVIGAVAAAVRSQLGRPVFFRQERPGHRGEVFELVKFRTMLEPDASRGRVTNDQRQAPFGQWLRSTSLDELPSLWNVVKGDMSLVGPRPLLVDYLPLYSREQARRHDVRPGLTGLAQINGRNALDWESRLELDVHYVANRSLRLDLMILWRTLIVVIRREGVTSEGHVVGAPFLGASAQERAENG